MDSKKKRLYLKPPTENSKQSTKPISKYAPSESSNSENENENIDKYFNPNTQKTNPYIIPQYERMILLQQRLRALEDENINNRKILQIMEQEYKNRIKYPKYTIIQNTPLTSREEIINEILKNKLGPNFVHSTNFPIVTYKNDIEINELIASTGAELLRNKEEKEKDEIKRKKLYDDSNSIYNNNNNINNNINHQTLLDMQKQNFELRNDYQKMFEGMKNMKNELENKMNNVLNKQKLTIENLRNIIEKGGNKKLKASMYKILENKDINLDEISDEEKEFKEIELPKIIQEKIDENEKKRINSYQLNDNENNEFDNINQRKNELPPINPFNKKDKFDNLSKNIKKIDKKKEKKKLDDLNDEEENESDDDKKNKKKKKKKNKKKKKKKNKKNDNENEEEEIEEEEDEDDDNNKKKKKKKKKKKNKNKKKKKDKKNSQEEEYEFSDKSIDIKTDKENEEKLGYVPILDLLEDWD